MTGRELGELPAWDEGGVATLSTLDEAGAPHAIPVSTALRAGPRTVVFGLAARRASLGFLRARPAVALSLVGAGVAFTAEGPARVLAEDAAGVVAVELDAQRIWDHRQPTFALEAGPAWRWTEPEAAARDAEVRAALRALAAR
jgi:hypothetical protein